MKHKAEFQGINESVGPGKKCSKD